MEFEAQTYETVKQIPSYTKLTIYASYIFFLLAFALNYFNQSSLTFYYGFTIGWILYIFAIIYQYFDYEKIETDKRGFLQINGKAIIISQKEKIPFDEISSLKINIDAYYGQEIHLDHNLRQVAVERKSCGLLNEFEIQYAQKTKKFNFKLENKAHVTRFFNILLPIVAADKLHNVDPKEAIALIQRHEQSEIFKTYILKLLKEKRIPCAYAIKQLGYNNYAEAQVLRKKHCSN